MKNFQISFLIISIFLMFGCNYSDIVQDSQKTTNEAPISDAEIGFDGVYKFIRVDTPNGPSTTQTGTMIVTDGTLCHVRVSNEREKFNQEDNAPEQEKVKMQAAAFISANAACGSFKLAGDLVEATWIAHLNPNEDGSTSKYIFRQDEGMLFFSPAASPQFSLVYQKIN
jgi:hypothetical protein